MAKLTYEEQCEIEKLNNQIFETITTTVSAEDFIAFYREHTRAETEAHYGIRTDKQLIKILKHFKYDFSERKSLNKGKPSTRSHESYVTAGKKSAETQRTHWREKPQEEKDAWSEKQKIAHSTKHFRSLISQVNVEYQASLSKEQKAEINAKRSKTESERWASYTKEEQEAIMANRFKNGRNCNNGHSKPNELFAEKLTAAGLAFGREFCLERKRFDFDIKDTNILIEVNPSITHNIDFNPFGDHNTITKYYHLDRARLAEKYGYRCIQVFDWDDPDRVIKLLMKKETVYARDCTVTEVSQKMAKDFINENHLQGYARDDIRLGLFHDGTLVSIMTFDKPRYNKKYDYELIRYCSSLNVIGGSERLFKHFINDHSGSIISYCDLSKFSGQTYAKLGFKQLRSPTPSKHWVNYRTGEHFTDNLLRQQGFSRLVHHCDAKEDNLPTDDNRELMLNADFVEVYDCGQATYVFERSAQ